MDIKILKEAALKFGTPIYLYDLKIIKNQFDILNKELSVLENYKIHFAAKSLSNISILKYIKKMGAGLDAVSIEEVMIGLKCGFNKDDILYTPNGVSFEEIKEVFKLGVKINLDSIESIKDFVDEFGNQPITVRINPGIYAGGNDNVSVGHSESKFGIPEERIDELLDMENKGKIKITGLHIHTGSDIEDINSFLKACDFVFEQAGGFKDLEFLDFGSGFKVKYFENDSETDIKKLGKKLGDKFAEFNSNRKNKIRMHIEPGKFLVSECGYFLTKVNYVNNRINKNFIHVNSGLNHFVRPMFYGSKHSIENISSNSNEIKNYSVVGYICETDTFSENVNLKKTNEGDILCFKNAGAYCFSMSSNYNSRFKPPEVLVSNNEIKLIRKRENFKDLIRNQSN